MNVRTESYNLDSDGSKNYLSDGQSRLIPLFFKFSLAYFFLCVLWPYYCYCNKETMSRVHLLITGLITAKMLSLISAGLDKYFVKLTRTARGWEIMFEVTRVTSSHIIIALIIIGFSLFKPFLQKKKAKAIIVAIALQVLPSRVLPFAMTMGDTWPDVVLLLSWSHLICVCTTLLITGRSHWSQRKAAKIDKKAATSSAKINKFAWWYILVMAYLYEIPVLADSLRIVMAYENSWVSNVVEEGANLTIFVVSLCMFRHVNEYIIIDAQDEKEETMAAANESPGFEGETAIIVETGTQGLISQ